MLIYVPYDSGGFRIPYVVTQWFFINISEISRFGSWKMRGFPLFLQAFCLTPVCRMGRYCVLIDVVMAIFHGEAICV